MVISGIQHFWLSFVAKEKDCVTGFRGFRVKGQTNKEMHEKK